MSEPSHVIRYEITAQAVVQANRAAQARLLTRYRVACLAAIPIGIILAVAVEPAIGLTVAIVAILSLATTYAAPLERLIIQRSARSVIGGTTALGLDDEGIAYHTPISTGSIPWSSLTEVRASDTTVVWHRDRILVAWAPTSAIGDRAAVASVVAFSRARMAAARR